MKKLFLMIALGFIATAVYAEDYYCKWCGQKFTNPATLVLNQCRLTPNPDKKHELFQGDSNQSRYMCEYCGVVSSSIKSLTYNKCPMRKNERHSPYEGRLKEEYLCKKCGRSFRNAKMMLHNICPRKGGTVKYHELAR